jgi:hypothetical protein
MHQHQMQETHREHVRQMQAMKDEMKQSQSRLEDQRAELVVAYGIASAASAQAEEHLAMLQSIQSELDSAKIGLQLQQEQLKQHENELHSKETAWNQEKFVIVKQHIDLEEELKAVQLKLSQNQTLEDQALSVRSIVVTSRALHPCSRALSAWAVFVRNQQRLFRQRASDGKIPGSLAISRRRNMLQSAMSQWQQWQNRILKLLRLEIAVTCLILHRRLKNFFGLWFQTACLSAGRRGSKRHTGSLLRTRVARILISNTTSQKELNSQATALLSHVIHLFSEFNFSVVSSAASKSFRAFFSGTAAPSHLNFEASELCLLLSACLKCIFEEGQKTCLYVR